ncbi:adenosylcobinamide-phosphate synthase CbiB [Huintestinicola sp.]|uniref:adenosylcobinamide-phosphate synthase CbiB n=1 Tax=Huintestinicola sp. TaxID=2981661 RepID=UPI003D7E7809
MPVIPLVIGFLLDFILGDPYSLPHPVRLIGTLISKLEGYFRNKISDERKTGTFLCVSVLIISAGIPALLLFICYNIHIILGIAMESILCYYLIAAKCLRDESMKVYKAIEEDDTEKARCAVSMIVGRDTNVLDRNGIIRAAVETVAENTSDGVTAPLFYMAFGGASLGFFYKAANTMDSMIGYKNEKYVNFGRTAAKLDDVLNFLPSRFTALLMIISAFFLGFDGDRAYRIWKRDRRNHSSPNSAQTEAAAAGALGVRLAGNAYYFGKLCEKPYIGDPVREIENEDIVRVNRLMYVSSFLMLIIACVVRMIVTSLIGGV